MYVALLITFYDKISHKKYIMLELISMTHAVQLLPNILLHIINDNLFTSQWGNL